MSGPLGCDIVKERLEIARSERLRPVASLPDKKMWKKCATVDVVGGRSLEPLDSDRKRHGRGEAQQHVHVIVCGAHRKDETSDDPGVPAEDRGEPRVKHLAQYPSSAIRRPDNVDEQVCGAASRHALHSVLRPPLLSVSRYGGSDGPGRLRIPRKKIPRLQP